MARGRTRGHRSRLAAKLRATPKEWHEAACRSEVDASGAVSTDGAALSLLSAEAVARAFAGVASLNVHNLFNDAKGRLLQARPGDMNPELFLDSKAASICWGSIDSDITGHVAAFPSLHSLTLRGMMFGSQMPALFAKLPALRSLELKEDSAL